MKYAKEEVFFVWNVMERDSDNFLFVPAAFGEATGGISSRRPDNMGVI